MPIINATKCSPLLRAFSKTLKILLLVHLVENFSLYKTVVFGFQISLSYSIKNWKNWQAPSVQLRSLIIFFVYLSIPVGLYLSSSMLSVKYPASIDRELSALCFEVLSKTPPNGVIQVQKAWKYTRRDFFWIYLQNSYFQKSVVLYERFIIIPSGIELDLEQNDVTCKRKTENLQIVPNANQWCHRPVKNRTFALFSNFCWKNCSSKWIL